MPWADHAPQANPADAVVEQLGPVAVTSAVRDRTGVIRDFRYEYVNAAFAVALGERPEALLGRCLLELYPSHTELGLFDEYRRVVDQQVEWEADLPWFDERAAQGYFHVRVRPFADGYVLEGRDVTFEQPAQLQRAARTAELRLDEIIQSIPESVVVMSAVRNATGALVDLRYERVNAAFSDLVGEDASAFVGHTLLELYPSHAELGIFAAYRDVVEHGEWYQAELPWIDERNVHAYVEVTAKPFGDGIIVTGRDVTERRRLADQRDLAAMSDPLTGLANRRMLMDRIAHDLTRLERDGGQLAVLFVDLDRFKDVNDTLGHDAGDAVLCEVAQRLVTTLRPTDTVARLGGDEFVVVLPLVRDDRDPAHVAQRLLEAVGAPLDVDGAPVRLGISIGIATTTGRVDPEDLVRSADLAMYRAKDRLGDRFEFFDDRISDEVHQRVAAEQALRAAVEGDEFEPWFQPEVDLATGRVVGFEALARWRRDGEVVPAAEWVADAEAAGLMTRLDRAVRARACAEFASWPRTGLGTLVRLWLNVSARELVEADTAEQLLATVDAAGLLPTDVGVEVTETALVEDAATAGANVERLVAAGVRVAVDDFGTGFASLASLRDLRVDTIKIDRAFTEGVPGDAFDDAVVAATVALSDTLELGVVGEGVETEAQRAALLAMGCATGQGFLFAPALPGPDAREVMAAGVVG